MSTVWFVVWGLFLTTFAVAADQGGEAKSGQDMLIDSKNLNARLGVENLRVIDTRSGADYSEGHIPGAINIDVAAWKKLEFDDSQGWAKIVGSLGIQADTHVVVYGTKLSNAARAWWLLKYVGVEKVSILDGGYTLWTKSHGPITAVTPKVAPVDFTPNFQSKR